MRQNYAKESEEGVNKQINLELYAFYTYTSMVRSAFPTLFRFYLPLTFPPTVLLL